MELKDLALLVAIGLRFKEVIQINFLVCLYRLTLLLLLCLHLTVDLIIVLRICLPFLFLLFFAFVFEARLL